MVDLANKNRNWEDHWPGQAALFNTGKFQGMPNGDSLFNEVIKNDGMVFNCSNEIIQLFLTQLLRSLPTSVSSRKKENVQEFVPRFCVCLKGKRKKIKKNTIFINFSYLFIQVFKRGWAFVYIKDGFLNLTRFAFWTIREVLSPVNHTRIKRIEILMGEYQ